MSVRAHEAGWAHADGALRGPRWLRAARRPQRAGRRGCGRTTAHKVDGGLEVGGRRRCRDLVAEHGTPAYVLDEADFRARARAFRDAFAGYDVFYAGKAFLCTTVARWVAEEGLCLDVCSGGELTVALRAGFDPARIGYHGNNKTVRRAAPRGRAPASAGSSSTRSTRSSGWPRSTAELGRDRAGDGAGDGRRRGAHPRVHRHRPRGPEVRLLDHLGRRPRGRTPGAATRRASSCSACTPTSARQIFDTSGFEVAARRVLALHAQVVRRARRRRCPSSTSAAASASPTRPRTTRPTRRSWPSR